MARLSRWGRLKLALAAMRSLARNFEDPWGPLAFQWALDQGGVQRVVAQAEQCPEGRALLAERPMFVPKPEELRRYAPGTFGHHLAAWYQRWGIPAFARRRTPESPLEYFMDRLFFTHDVWHAVAGYGTELHEELRLLCFLLGQYFSGSAVVAFLIGALQLLRRDGPLPVLGLPFEFVRIFRRSRRARRLAFVRWETMLDEPVEKVLAFALEPDAPAPRTSSLTPVES